LEKLRSKLVLFLIFLSCTITFEKKILIEDKVENRKTPGINFLNYEEAINEGYYNEVENFLKRNKNKIKGNSSLAFAEGKIKLVKGNIKKSIEIFNELLEYTSPAVPVYRKTLWNLSIAYYFNNEFFKASEMAERANKGGQPVDKGFRNFLKISPKEIYKTNNFFVENKFEYLKKKIPIIEINLNDRLKEKAVIDTGASLSFISLSLAEELNIEITDDLKSQGFGFHQKLIPVWLSYLSSIEMDKLKIYNVPVMIFRDDDLTFGTFKVRAGIGFHLIKEGILNLDFKNRFFSFKIYKEEEKEEGNLLFLGLRAGVEITINGAGYYNFILDTGSEKTYITNNGAKKALLSEKLNLFDVITRGIGKARVEYRKIEDSTVGLGMYKIWYSNILLKSEDSRYVDGILGNDFLENFKVVMDFPKNKINIML
jgi:hypothetical protein